MESLTYAGADGSTTIAEWEPYQTGVKRGRNFIKDCATRTVLQDITALVRYAGKQWKDTEEEWERYQNAHQAWNTTQACATSSARLDSKEWVRSAGGPAKQAQAVHSTAEPHVRATAEHAEDPW